MNIALLSDESKQELMIQFCIAYCGILAKHTLCATSKTGKVVAKATGLDVKLFLSDDHNGAEHIGQHILYDELDMVLFFTGQNNEEYLNDLTYICHLCDIHNVPCATNIATAEMLIMGLNRGDLDYREILYPRSRQVLV